MTALIGIRHVTPDGRDFVVVGTRPHTLKDGRETILLEWVGRCRACSTPYIVTTTTNVAASGSFGTVHCPEHRKVVRRRPRRRSAITPEIAELRRSIEAATRRDGY